MRGLIQQIRLNLWFAYGMYVCHSQIKYQHELAPIIFLRSTMAFLRKID